MYITKLELLLLLFVFWGPAFAIAGFAQWVALSKHSITEKLRLSRKVGLLFLAFSLQIALAFAVWLSPIHTVFFVLDSIGSLPMQAGIIAAIAVTTGVLLGLRVYAKKPVHSEL
ncbi:MAG: hypothetical protein AB8B96_04740 [Lysobacterales bacterium]